MPVVSPEKLAKLQQNPDDVRNAGFFRFFFPAQTRARWNKN
jgi:hypothetical protein